MTTMGSSGVESATAGAPEWHQSAKPSATRLTPDQAARQIAETVQEGKPAGSGTRSPPAGSPSASNTASPSSTATSAASARSSAPGGHPGTSQGRLRRAAGEPGRGRRGRRPPGAVHRGVLGFPARPGDPDPGGTAAAGGHRAEGGTAGGPARHGLTHHPSGHAAGALGPRRCLPTCLPACLPACLRQRFRSLACTRRSRRSPGPYPRRAPTPEAAMLIAHDPIRALTPRHSPVPSPSSPSSSSAASTTAAEESSPLDRSAPTAPPAERTQSWTASVSAPRTARHLPPLLSLVLVVPRGGQGDTLRLLIPVRLAI